LTPALSYHPLSQGTYLSRFLLNGFEVWLLAVVKADDVEAEEVGEIGVKAKIQWLITREVGAPNFSMRRFVVEEGGEIKRHSHDWEHEIYILQGEAVIGIGEKEFKVSGDTAVYIPPNTPHWYRNTGRKPLIFICVIPHRNGAG